MILYLPFTFERKVNSIKKLILSYFLFPVFAKRRGFLSGKLNEGMNYSQYFSYFNKLNLKTPTSRKLIDQFLSGENISIWRKENNTKRKVALYINSKLTMKIWSIENYVNLVNHLDLYFRNNIEFYLIGSKEDFEYNELVFSKINKQIYIKNIAGTLTIKDTCNFLSTVDLLIGNDGAPLHFAALVNTPIVGLYTFKEQAGTWEPIIAENFIVFRADVPCKHCYKSACSNVICLKYINYFHVLDAVKELLIDNRGITKQQIRIELKGLYHS